MRIVNIGSINIDHVYRVDHICAQGETVAALEYAVHGGGKGANQSLAIARAGGRVAHVGKVGRDGQWLVDALARAGVDVSGTVVCDEPTGHAIIQVDRGGQNSIVVHGGTNRKLTEQEVDAALGACARTDVVLLQNETNLVPEIIRLAARRGLRVCLNPAPMSRDMPGYDLSGVSLFVVNEAEGRELSGKRSAGAIIEAMTARYPSADVVLTLGGEGLHYGRGSERLTVPALRVKAVDTTAAGDTFIGYLLASLQRGQAMAEALRTATTAAAISVTRPGAAPSIPTWDEVVAFKPA